MPSCSVPPSRISVLTFSAIEYSARGIGAFGGQNSRVPGSSSRKSNVSAATSASPYMKGSSLCT